MTRTSLISLFLDPHRFPFRFPTLAPRPGGDLCWAAFQNSPTCNECERTTLGFGHQVKSSLGKVQGGTFLLPTFTNTCGTRMLAVSSRFMYVVEGRALEPFFWCNCR